MTETTTSVAALERELAEIGGLIAEAAAEGDEAEWTRLRMRADALPLFIERQRLEPLRARLERLYAELDGLVAERERVLAEDPPEPPPASRGTVTALQMRQRLLDSVAGRERSAGRERREVLAKIAEVKGTSAPLGET